MMKQSHWSQGINALTWRVHANTTSFDKIFSISTNLRQKRSFTRDNKSFSDETIL